MAKDAELEALREQVRQQQEQQRRELDELRERVRAQNPPTAAEARRQAQQKMQDGLADLPPVPAGRRDEDGS